MKRSLKRACREKLRQFGLKAYRPGQKAAAHALLSGRDLLCVLPTGAGKSLCWQLPALVQQGMTVVISPLIALMQDQVSHLRQRGVSAVAVNSLMSKDERRAALEALQTGRSSIVFVAPERLFHADFSALCRHRPPKLVVVDEAHCVVQWGDAFRPAYARIADFVRALPKRPVLCAMTATADRAMQKQIADSLGMRRAKRIMLPILRENLVYRVKTCLDRDAELLRIAPSVQGKMVIFCRTRGRTEDVAALLQKSGYAAAFYHAGLDQAQREQTQQRFAAGAIRILAATTAFGMGVDIPDIRCVVHDALPDSLIDYVQQSGRAGRDRQRADCILLFIPKDALRQSNRLRRKRREAGAHPTKLRAFFRDEWLPCRQLLRAVLCAPCIPAYIAKVFGSRVKGCGVCSACQSGPMQRRIPALPWMSRQQVCAWFLQWQRQAIAQREGISERRVLSGSALSFMAKRLCMPKKKGRYDGEFARLIDHLRQ